jgi:hypothetical protein
MEDPPNVRDRRIIDSARQAIARSRDLLKKKVPRIAPKAQTPKGAINFKGRSF